MTADTDPTDIAYPPDCESLAGMLLVVNADCLLPDDTEPCSEAGNNWQPPTQLAEACYEVLDWLLAREVEIVVDVVNETAGSEFFDRAEAWLASMLPESEHCEILTSADYDVVFAGFEPLLFVEGDLQSALNRVGGLGRVVAKRRRNILEHPLAPPCFPTWHSALPVIVAEADDGH